jgi:hypothetical protein
MLITFQFCSSWKNYDYKVVLATGSLYHILVLNHIKFM